MEMGTGPKKIEINRRNTGNNAVLGSRDHTNNRRLKINKVGLVGILDILFMFYRKFQTS